jgi:SWI/SNF-related matrix-associated actin-dependent regulator 1 of chromatin subfamily A
LNDLPKALLKNLYRFQKQGIIFGIKKYSRLLIADEMGVGKTVQAIGLSCLYQKDWPVLVICPSSLKFAWRDEITLWLGEILKKDEVQVIKHSKNEFKEDKKYYIISYDLSVRMIDKIIEKKFNYIIADEAHYLKSRSAKRTMSLTPILQRSKRVVLLTGTPILAKPMEIFSLLHILRPDKFKGFKEFGTRYCDPKMLPFGLIDWSGSSNSRELNSILNKLMIRRLKKDVLSQLPPKKRQKIEIATDSKVIKRLKIFMEKSSKKFEELLGTQIELDKLGINAEDINISNKKEKDSDNKSKDNEEESILNKFNKAYSMTGEAKLPGIRDYVNYLVDNSCKFLIFAHHSEVLDAIEDVIIDDKIGYIRIDGKVAIDKRQDLVNKFQTDEECLVAILSITACATGLTLTKASTVVFAELHFTPSIMIQAEDRAHRIGQDAGCVNIHYLVGEDTLDVLLFRKLNEKQNIVSTTLDNKSKDLNVTKIKEQVGDFINMNGKQISVDERKNITQVVDKSNATIISYLSSKNRINNNEIDNDIKIEEKEYNSVVDVNNKEIMKNMNLHEINGRRSSLKEEEEKKDNVDDNKEKKKRKKKGKKNDKNKNKNMTNYLDEKENKSENNNINEENKILNDKQIIEDMDKDKFFEEEKEIENIYGDEIKSENDKLFEDKVLMDIFDFNKL